MSDVSDLLDRYAAGDLPLGVVVADFIGRRWTPDRPPAATYAEQAERELDDPGLIPDNSWLEVEAAYVAGQISDSVYRALYDAVGGRARP